ncbi:hypothetical protein GCM10010377_23810 [Streptomyces viridiviolaceus]|nr:hypothetical protein GCM10010377_23810 [Streptomyces viridiviolaceus]
MDPPALAQQRPGPGIGLAVARRPAAGGAALAVADINDKGAQRAVGARARFHGHPPPGRRDRRGAAQLIDLHPAERLGTAEDVAELAAFLLSECASFVNGSSHHVDGGHLSK